MKSEVFNIDCMEGMKDTPDNWYDLAVCDPPYFEGPNKRGHYGKKHSSIEVKRVDYPITEQWGLPNVNYFNELTRVSKDQIIFGINYFDFKCGSGRIVWDKCNDSSSFSDCEIAYCSKIDHVRIYRFMWNGMLQGDPMNGIKMQGNKSLNEKRIHPTQKPVAIYNWIFKNFAMPGYKILDTHVGSGSSRISAYEWKLLFSGHEINKIHFNNQEKRFQNHISQLKMFP